MTVIWYLQIGDDSIAGRGCHALGYQGAPEISELVKSGNESHDFTAKIALPELCGKIRQRFD